MSGVFPLMPLDCTICTAMLANGVAINGTKIMKAHQLTEVAGKVTQVGVEWYVVATGILLRFIPAVPIVAGIPWVAASWAAVFV